MVKRLGDLVIWYGTHRRQTPQHITPATYGIDAEEAQFESHNVDRERIFAWIVHAKEPKATVLLCHGIDSAGFAMLPKAKALSRRGYTCVVMDFRGTGRSGGTHCTLGLKEADDVRGVVAGIEAHPMLRDRPIFAIGESMGGSAVIRAAASTAAIRAVVSESTYATLQDALWQRIKLLGPLAPSVARHCHTVGRSQFGVDIPDISPERDIALLSPRPLLLIHDSFDVLCTKRESDRLYKAAREPKERWDVPYAPHTFAYMVSPRAYTERVVGFLDRCAAASS